MKNYVIDEILEVLCDTDKILTVKFKLEDDNTKYRELVDSEYYYWCEEHYFVEGQTDINTEESNDELDYYGFRFDIEIWENIYSDFEIIMEYIYDNYLNKNDLPNKVG
jgi:hypothetical protein